jgi:hypothetical protein
MLSGWALEIANIQKAADEVSARMFRGDGLYVIVELHFPSDTAVRALCAHLDRHKTRVSAQRISIISNGMVVYAYKTFRQSQTVDWAPYPSFPITLYLFSKISPTRTG